MQGVPQCITRRGEDAVMVIRVKDYQKLTKYRPNFSEFLQSGVKYDELDIERAMGKAREFKL